MPSLNIEENLINENYLIKLKNELSALNKWVMFSNKKCNFSNKKEFATDLICTIDSCSHLVNKFFSTIYLNLNDRNIIPPTYYILNSKWIGNIPENSSNEWLIKDVWDYSESNSKKYSSIQECISTSVINKYYVVQPYLDNLDLVRCYIIIYRNQNKTNFYLFNDGYYNIENEYIRFKDHPNYNNIFSKIKNNIQIHLHSLSNSINKKSETNIDEFQLFEYLYGVNESDCYLLNCSIQLTIFEHNYKVFNILTSIIIKDIINNLIIPVIDNKLNNVEIDSEQLSIMDCNRWDEITIPDDQYEISNLLLMVLENSKQQLYKLKNTNINTFYFDKINTNNTITGFQKLLEGLGDWKESKKDTGFSDSYISVVKYGMNLESILNISTLHSFLKSKYLPLTYISFLDITDKTGIWSIKNISTGENIVTNLLEEDSAVKTIIKDDFLFIDEEDIIVYQKDIRNLMLINNRKFIIKTYCLLSCNKDINSDELVNSVLLNIDGIIFCASKDYNSDNINIDIHSFDKISSDNKDISKFAIHFSDWNKYNKFYPIICKIVKQLFTNFLNNNTLTKLSVQLYSIDFMITNDEKVYITDISSNPTIMNDKRMWYESSKILITSILKDIIDTIVTPYLNGTQIQDTSRWVAII